jgi:hypothetical protein
MSNRTDRHDITEILLKGTFNTIKPNHPFTDGQIQKILIKCHQNGHHAAILPDNFVVVEKIKVAEQQPFINVFVYYHPLL